MNQATSTMKGMTKMETCTLEPTATPIAMSILSLYAMTTAVAAHVHTSRTPITKHQQHQQHTRAQLELRGSATRRRPFASAKGKEKQERLRV